VRAHPAHVTLRVVRELPCLRDRDVATGVVEQVRRASRKGFRVIAYSIQGDHMHLLVEALGSRTFTSGMRGLTIRIARAVNRALGRSGPVLRDRYHTRALTTPTEMRNAYLYVLANRLKHLVRVDRRARDDDGELARTGIDPVSSGPWFTGWRGSSSRTSAIVAATTPVARPTLASVGWRRAGLIDRGECPRSGPQTLDGGDVADRSYVFP
jgi:hypothetical protein